jgi:hypothetical protein
MPRKNQIVEEYAHMWPREVFDCLVPDENNKKKQNLVKGLELLDRKGVYVLYRDDVPYYVGQAIRLRGRMKAHASIPGSRYHNSWNFFSAFVIPDQGRRNEIEGILIAAMPTANSAKPRLKKAKFPPAVKKMARHQERSREPKV